MSQLVVRGSRGMLEYYCFSFHTLIISFDRDCSRGMLEFVEAMCQCGCHTLLDEGGGVWFSHFSVRSK